MVINLGKFLGFWFGLVLCLSTTPVVAASGGFGGGAFGGGGSSGSWTPEVRCNNHPVGYWEARNCSEYKGANKDRLENGLTCRYTCTDNKGSPQWLWSVEKCVSGYHLDKNGRCHKDAVSISVPKKVTPVTLSVHGVVVLLEEGKVSEPAVGATVMLRDKPSVGVAADSEGKFSFEIGHSSDVLHVRYIGYHDKYVPASQCLKGCRIELKRKEEQLGSVEVVACSGKLLAQLDAWEEACADGYAEILAAINAIRKYCKDPREVTESYEVLYARLEALKPNECSAASTSRSVHNKQSTMVNLQTQSRDKIASLNTQISRLSEEFGVSVWKNATGGFNTARLVSDSVAGVVLGTAGGLITSSVVKKNQVRGGFENIHCTISGQNVAEYGDDFSVGTQLW